EVRHDDDCVEAEDDVEAVTEELAGQGAHATASIRVRTIPAATVCNALVSSGFASWCGERRSRSESTKPDAPPDEVVRPPAGRTLEAAIRTSRSCSTRAPRSTGHSQLTACQSAREAV